VGFTVQLDGPPARGRWQVAVFNNKTKRTKEKKRKEQGLNQVIDSTVGKIETSAQARGACVLVTHCPTMDPCEEQSLLRLKAATIERQNCNDPVGRTRVP